MNLFLAYLIGIAWALAGSWVLGHLDTDGRLDAALEDAPPSGALIAGFFIALTWPAWALAMILVRNDWRPRT